MEWNPSDDPKIDDFVQLASVTCTYLNNKKKCTFI